MTELYSTLLSNVENKPTFQIYFGNSFPCTLKKMWQNISATAENSI